MNILSFASRGWLLLCPFVACALLHGAETQRTDMTGHVKGPDGKPVPNALAIIVGAGPREGSSPLCPYNYPDCGKRAMTDSDGSFHIESLDPAMDFWLAVLAPGFEPFNNSKILPEAGPVQVNLKVRDLSMIPPGGHAYGRIIGPDGHPVAGATLDIEGVQHAESTTWGCPDTDGMVASDADGQFEILGKKPFTAVYAVVNAHGLARRWARLEPGKMCLLRMNKGVTVRGRLAFNGQPLKNLKVGMDSVERECGKFFSGFRATTDDNGGFEFSDVPLDTKFSVFSILDSFQKTGAGFRREFDSGSRNVDLGEIKAEPTYHLIGRVVLGDGKPVPSGTRMLLDAWDILLVPLDADGRFDATGVPAGQTSLYLSLNGYHFSTKNPSLDSNHRGLIGRVSGDIPDLNILLEPGSPPNYEDIDHLSYEEQKKRKDEPLRGMH
jgi:hypothetical protein